MIKLTPILDPLVKEFINEQSTITTLLNCFGSPLNIIFPEKLSDNIASLQQIFEKHHLKGKIYYAHKANKSKAFVKQAHYEGILIDAASEKELIDALASGYQGGEIEVTGPKNLAFLLLAIQQRCLIQVDNFSELEQIILLHKKIKHKESVKTLIRFGGFSSEDTKIVPKDSRFGIDIKDYKKVTNMLLENRKVFNFQGFSYHLDANTPQEKTIALENLIQMLEKFQEVGLNPQIINIGGGFKICYIADEKEWTDFIGSLQQAALGKIPSITWHNTNFGFRNEGNVIRGATNFYEYFTKQAGAEYLDEILSTKLSSYDNLSAGDVLSEIMMQLVIEPGRSLLNQAGITIAKVNFVKESPQGEILIGLDMNRSNLASTDQEMMLDPIIIYKNITKEEGDYGVYFIGNLCLESDFIYKHKTFIRQLPEVGDLVIFVNTAAYNMDFTESATIQQQIAKKIAVVKRNNKFLWFEDEQYNPYLLEEQL